MGAICSRRSTVDSSPDSNSGDKNVHGHTVSPQSAGMGLQSSGVPSKVPSNNTPPANMENMEKELQEQNSISNSEMFFYENRHYVNEEREPERLSRVLSNKSNTAKSKPTTVSEVGSLLGRAGTVGLGKAVEVLDTLGSSMTNLNLNSGFASGVTSKGIKIGILAFEVANTVVKGSNLKQSLSEENIKLLKEEVLRSEGVQHLVSKDMDELLRIAAADKRDELRIFAGEVVRFGNHCKDPQWHHLGRYFEKLGTELPVQKQSKEEAEAVMQQLMNLAQHTAVSRPNSVPPSTRDTLYQGLPPSIKSALRSKLQSYPVKEELTTSQIKAEMEKILAWLVPVATNTTKAHHGFGWVGEWANTGSALDRRLPGHSELTLIQTFHHADKEKTEFYIFELIVWLHHLVSQTKSTANGNKSPIKSPIRSPVQKNSTITLPAPDKPPPTGNGHIKALSELSQDEKDMLKDVNFRKLTPGISKSQEFDTAKLMLPSESACRLSKSNSHSPTTDTKNEFNDPRRNNVLPTIDFDIDRIKGS